MSTHDIEYSYDMHESASDPSADVFIRPVLFATPPHYVRHCVHISCPKKSRERILAVVEEEILALKRDGPPATPRHRIVRDEEKTA